MKALKYVGILLLTLIALILIIGLFAPKKSHLERSITINANPQQVQDIVSRFSEYNKWSPWIDYDPNAKTTIEGQDGSVGSKYTWAGNKDIGAGNQTITKIEPGFVGYHLNFLKPMSGEAEVGMKLVQEGSGTKAIWSFDSESPYPMNVMSLIFSLEKMLGPDFEKGLNKLKSYTESKKPLTFRGYEVKESVNSAKYFAGIRKTINLKDIPTFLESSYGLIGQALAKAGVQGAGAPSGLYYTYDEKSGKTDMAAAIPVTSNAKISGLEVFEIPVGKELSVDFYGAYEKTGDAHYAIDDYAKSKNAKLGAPAIEQYITDPIAEKDTARWLTKIFCPLIN